jgi:hypothetical protein
MNVYTSKDRHVVYLGLNGPSIWRNKKLANTINLAMPGDPGFNLAFRGDPESVAGHSTAYAKFDDLLKRAEAGDFDERRDPSTFRWRDIWYVARLLGIVRSDETQREARRLKALVDVQVKHGFGKQIAKGVYSVEPDPPQRKHADHLDESDFPGPPRAENRQDFSAMTPHKHEDGYARQKLWQAVDALIGKDPIEMRLSFTAHPLRQLQPEQIPPSIAEELHAVLDELTRTPMTDGEKYLPRQVSREEAAKLSDRIFSMFVQVMGGL